MQRKIEEIIRVDQAGELGAINIYKGQLAVLKRKKLAPTIRKMLLQEEEHYEKFSALLLQHKVRPTLLSPFWKLGAFGLGIFTASLGPKATMACTEAVEEVIVKHYLDQSYFLKNKNKELSDLTKKLASEEEDHMRISKDHGTGNNIGHKILKFGIKKISKIAIRLSEKI
tara:strand:+ start:2594 stop:3103 length:510 start_codon:yes stop_codon:yes gene_type:complete